MFSKYKRSAGVTIQDSSREILRTPKTGLEVPKPRPTCGVQGCICWASFRGRFVCVLQVWGPDTAPQPRRSLGIGEFWTTSPVSAIGTSEHLHAIHSGSIATRMGGLHTHQPPPSSSINPSTHRIIDIPQMNNCTTFWGGFLLGGG